MWLKIGLGAVAVVALFLGYVSTRSGKFHYERSGIINAPAEKIYPYLSEFKKGSLWSPYEKKDPNMKKTYSGTDGTVGAKLEFDGNSDVGSGNLEIVGLTPNESVMLKLTMLKPFEGVHLVQYTLTPEGSGTRFTWSMTGDGGFLSKLITLVIDCEKMVSDQFNQGISDLKSIVENDAQI